jgi:hypothetical protein
MIIKYRAFPFIFMLQEQVIYKVPLTAMMLKDAIQTIRGSIMICYPMGLPSYDPVQQAVVGTAKCVYAFPLPHRKSRDCFTTCTVLSFVHKDDKTFVTKDPKVFDEGYM